MIGFLRGQILDMNEGKVLLGVGGDAGLVGYAVMVPQSYLNWPVGKTVDLFIHTHVREDALDLYGFATAAEKELYLTLLTVNGIGPKGGMGIMSKVAPSQLIQAVLDGDKESLTQIPGIGKKTAERVVLELADPLRKKVEAGILGGARAVAQTSGSGATAAGPQLPSSLMRDTREALMGLGYREQEVSPVLRKIFDEGKPDRVPLKIEDAIRVALQRLS